MAAMSTNVIAVANLEWLFMLHRSHHVGTMFLLFRKNILRMLLRICMNTCDHRSHLGMDENLLEDGCQHIQWWAGRAALGEGLTHFEESR